MWGWLEAVADRLDGSEFVIRYRPGRPLAVRGPVPQGKQAGIRAFLEQDVGVRGPLRIRGQRGSDRGLRLIVAGPLESWQQQRLRNYLLEELG